MGSCFTQNHIRMSKITGTLTKRYYSISEVAKMFDVSKSLIRFWDQEFDVLTPVKNNKGERRFTTQNIEQFELIYHLVKEQGFTLNGARKEIRRRKKMKKRKEEVIEKLIEIKSFLKQLQSEL